MKETSLSLVVCAGSPASRRNALVQAIEERMQTRWRAVTAGFAVECAPPFRTVVLRGDVLRLYEQMMQRSDGEVVTLNATMFTPLLHEGEDSDGAASTRVGGGET